MPLKPFRVTANLPGEIQELIERRVREEKYPSLSAYVIGLVLFDLYARKQHLLTGTLMREPQWIRDQVIAELVRDFDDDKAKPGGWFEHRIEELIRERHEDDKGEREKDAKDAKDAKDVKDLKDVRKERPAGARPAEPRPRPTKRSGGK